MSGRNLCATVENRPRYQTMRCTVPHEKVTPLYRRLAAEDGDPSHIWDTAHQWSDHAGGLNGGTCIHCHMSLKQLRVRINPKTGEPIRRSGALARAIAVTLADIPPVKFTGGQP